MSKLGVIDSGLGGYLIAKRIHKQYPLQDVVFLADQNNLPYGNKSSSELNKILSLHLKWFKEKGVDDVLIACNTLSTLDIKNSKMNIYKIIDMTSLQVSDFNEVIVIATEKTTKSHMYKSALKKLNSRIKVHEVALPNLASLIENCASRKEITNELEKYLSIYRESGIPTVLGCTHYPIVKEMIADYLKCETFDSIIPVLNQDIYTVGDGRFECYTTNSTENFEKQVKKLFNDKVECQKAIVSNE